MPWFPLPTFTLLVSALGALACRPAGVVEPGDPAASCPAPGAATAPRAPMLIGGDPTCPEWGCGTNSPTLGDGVVFDELDTAGTLDRHGIRIVGVVRNGASVQLRVDRDTLSVVDAANNLIQHDDLIGTRIQLERAGKRYELSITAVDENSLRFWTRDAEIVPAYEIRVITPGNPNGTLLCRHDVAASEPPWKPVEHAALVFAGDRYDPARKTVSDAGPTTTWFNLACAATATAKLHLMRHTNAGAWTAATWKPGHDLGDSSAPFHTTRDERQAMLKMFSADYCGTGQSFTVDGQPLVYGDAAAWHPETPTTKLLATTPPPVATIEALWNAQGAVCLDTPRRATIAEVHQVCCPRPCGGVAGALGWERRAHVISANPP